MKKNILIPTDFSDNAWSAAVYGLKLLAKTECNFYFLHSSKMKTSSMSSFSNKLLKVMLTEAQSELLELKEMAEKCNINARHEFNIILSQDTLTSAIKRAIKKYKIDLVLMGTKGVTGAKEIFLGSNSVKIIKQVKSCPVMLIPDEYDFEEPKQIAFPTDFNRFYGNELTFLIWIASLFNSKIRVVHIDKEEALSDIQDYNLSMLKSYLENYAHSFHWMPDYTDKTNTIIDFIDELAINILVMINYKHSFIENILNEPVIEKIGSHTTIPFLVIHSVE